MPRSDPHPSHDWRGWIILAWVLGCSLLYGQMVFEQRGGKVQGWIARLVREVRPPAKS